MKYQKTFSMHLFIMLIDSVNRAGKNYYPQVFLEEFQCVVKEKKMDKYITDKTETSSDKENSKKKKSEKENSDGEEQIKHYEYVFFENVFFKKAILRMYIFEGATCI